jgi:hypothetical protein
MTVRLTPLMESALLAMLQGSLTRDGNRGWVSTVPGAEGVWNSHTIRWMASRRFCVISMDKSKASITPNGKAMIGYEAAA